MIARLERLFVRPAAYFIGVAIVVAALIVVIGTLLLRLHPHEIERGNLVSEFVRPDLIVAFGLSVLILFACAVLARFPGSEGALDRQVAVGRTDFWDEPAQRESMAQLSRRGPRGSLTDVQEGFTLFAQSGPLGTVISVLPGETEYGRRRRGFLFARGLHGANDAMWIPVEAVTAVYPETATVFLAAKGDEVEHFGWNRPPESFRRDPQTIHIPKA